jgi:hypothetical protein
VELSVTLLPIKAGTVPLPNISLVCDRGLNNSLSLYETRQVDGHVQYTFVTPL